MNNIKLPVFFICLLFASPLYAQTFTKTWDHTYGGYANELVSVIKKVPGTGFMIGGSSFSGINGDVSEDNYDTSYASTDFWLLLTDPAGNKIWDHRYGSTGHDLHYETIVVPDGYVSGGHTFSPAGFDITSDNRDSTLNSNDYWIIKTDFNGQKIWDARFGGSKFENFGTVRATPDGGYIIAGSTYSDSGGDISEPSRGGWDYWLVKTDSLGIKLWDKRFGGAGEDFAIALEVAPNGHIIVAGYSNSEVGGDKSEPSRGGIDYWIVESDELGTKIWDKTLGGSDTDWLFSLALTSDGGILAGGQSFSPVSGEKSEPNHDPTSSGSDRWVIKTDGNGSKLWDRTYGGDHTDDLSQLLPTQDGGFLVSGESYSQISGDKTEANLGMEQTWILKADSVGNKLWDKTIFTLGHDESGFVTEDSAGCFIAVNFCTADTGGYKTEDSKGFGDYFMVRVCFDSTVSVGELATQPEWQIRPNPASSFLELVNPENDELILVEIIDVTGKQFFSTTSFSKMEAITHIPLAGLASGLYSVRIKSTNGVVVLPFVKAGTD